MLEKLRSVIEPKVKDRGQRHDDAENSKDYAKRSNRVVPPRWLRFGVFVLADELEVATVRLVGRVENVAHDWERAGKHVDQDVEDHAKHDNARHPTAKRQRHEADRADAGHRVANARKQNADDWVQPEPKVGPWDAKPVIQQGDEALRPSPEAMK